jgi:hypothetical protein
MMYSALNTHVSIQKAWKENTKIPRYSRNMWKENTKIPRYSRNMWKENTKIPR